MMTSRAIQDNMTDFADEFGDQELIKEMIVWLNHKMGGYWNVAKVTDESRKTKMELLEQLRLYAKSLPTDELEDIKAVGRIYDFVIQELSKL
jgi:hypothetical protein